MTRLTLGALTAIIIGVVTAFAVASGQSDDATTSGKADLIGTDGAGIGDVTFREGPEGVVIRIVLEGLPPGWHGVHLHEVGDCSDPDAGFKASGGHINPYGRKHGLLHPEGPDNADLPNLYVHQDGTAKLEYYTTMVSLDGKERRPALMDDNGSALVIHANPDDMVSQPIGGAGPRIACGVVKAG